MICHIPRIQLDKIIKEKTEVLGADECVPIVYQYYMQMVTQLQTEKKLLEKKCQTERQLLEKKCQTERQQKQLLEKKCQTERQQKQLLEKKCQTERQQKQLLEKKYQTEEQQLEKKCQAEKQLLEKQCQAEKQQLEKKCSKIHVSIMSRRYVGLVYKTRNLPALTYYGREWNSQLILLLKTMHGHLVEPSGCSVS